MFNTHLDYLLNKYVIILAVSDVIVKNLAQFVEKSTPFTTANTIIPPPIKVNQFVKDL